MRKTNDLVFCSWDSLTIYDGGSSASSMMGKYCGDSIPPSHVSSGNEVLIHFEADAYNGNNNGFKMEYNPIGNTKAYFVLKSYENCQNERLEVVYHHQSINFDAHIFLLINTKMLLLQI